MAYGLHGGLRIALAAEKDLQAVLNEDGYVERYTGVSSTNASQDHEQAKEALEATDETR